MKVIISFKCIHCNKSFKQEGDDTNITKHAHERIQADKFCPKANGHIYKIDTVEVTQD